MSLASTQAEVISLAGSIGQAALHALYPNDFEYYALGLDLCDSENRIIDTLVFPVMPDGISEPRPSINSVKKTTAGVVSIYNTTFVPFDITIRGTFGRKLRILSNNGLYVFNGTSGIVQGGSYDAPVFNTSIKTGYGTLKLLERIRDKSFTVDDKGKPVRLYYYNLALNSQYMVEFRNLTMTQDRQNNMIWNYTATFKAIAPAYSIRGNKKTSLISLLASDILNKGVNALVDGYRDTFNQRQKSRMLPGVKQSPQP